MINAIYILPTKTASCPVFGDKAIAKKMNVPWGKHKVGDIVLFDFNGNGTSDHAGIVIGVSGNTITTIEGNTGIGNNTNGGQVQKRTRSRDVVNYFVRPKYNEDVTADMVIATAKAEIGYNESPKNSNKTKYGKWIGVDGQPWCCSCVCWVFAHVKTKAATTKKAYTGSLPNLSKASRKYLKKGDQGKEVTKWQRFLNWAGYNCGKADGKFGDKTEGATKSFQYKNGLTADGLVGNKTIAKAKQTKK